MGRTAKIPRDEALRSAMKLFWQRGYSATTLDDIQIATRLQRGSIYAYFENKEGLYREALELYHREIVLERRARVRSAKSAKAGIKGFFASVVAQSVEQRKHPGCLNTNTAAELSLIDQDIAEKVRLGLSSWEDFWVEVLERARSEGSIEESADLRVIARLMIVLTQGLNVVGKVKHDREYLSGIVKAGLGFLK